VVARPLLGVLADLIGRYNVIGPTTFISGVLCLAIWFTSTSYASLMSYTVLYGFWSSTVLSLTAPCVAQISRPELVGTRVGLTYAVMSFP
jgi:MFS family permease